EVLGRQHSTRGKAEVHDVLGRNLPRRDVVVGDLHGERIVVVDDDRELLGQDRSPREEDRDLGPPVELPTCPLESPVELPSTVVVSPSRVDVDVEGGDPVSPDVLEPPVSPSSANVSPLPGQPTPRSAP